MRVEGFGWTMSKFSQTPTRLTPVQAMGGLALATQCLLVSPRNISCKIYSHTYPIVFPQKPSSQKRMARANPDSPSATSASPCVFHPLLQKRTKPSLKMRKQERRISPSKLGRPQYGGSPGLLLRRGGGPEGGYSG